MHEYKDEGKEYEGKKKILQQQKMTIEKMNSSFIYGMKVVL